MLKTVNATSMELPPWKSTLVADRGDPREPADGMCLVWQGEGYPYEGIPFSEMKAFIYKADHSKQIQGCVTINKI